MVEQLELDGFIDRLRELIGSDSVSKFAQEVGLGDNLVRKYLAGATPGLDKVLRICQAKQVNVEWLALGRGPRQGFVTPGPRTEESAAVYGQTPDRVLRAADGREFVLLPRYVVTVSAGSGTVVRS